MVVHQIVVQHDGTPHPIEFDTDDGLEVLKIQLFSLTLIPPEKQKIIAIPDKPLTDESDFLNIPFSNGCILTLLEEEEGSGSSASMSGHDLAAIEKADEELARLLQAEEEAAYLQQQMGDRGQVEFANRIEPYISQVLQYEDPSHQEAARRSVPQHELEEKAAIALAKEGKRSPNQLENEHALLFQLLSWFKESFRWVNAPPCTICGAETDGIGMGRPNPDELRYGGNRVELYRCRRCSKITRFPRYNDTLKLIETRSGRCGEWANCFTLYCRALGYQARLVLDFTDHVWTECFSGFLGRWVHLDPCEGAFDKPLLYEQGWGKKLNYAIALSRDGVYDVTKRYTKNWNEVRVRRNITSEQNVKEVTARLTSRMRSTFQLDHVKELQERDKQEADEIQRSQKEFMGLSEALPGRQTGAEEWRMARGEMGVTVPPVSNKTACPLRLCVDNHVSKILEALGFVFGDFTDKDSMHRLDSILKALCGVLYKLKEVPFKMRQIQVSLQEASLLGEALDADKFGKLLQALGLKKRDEHGGELWICVDGDPVETALALPVALENLENLHSASKSSTGLDNGITRLRFLAQNERLCGGSTQASGEEPPLGIATSAFDGLQSTKWEEPCGAKGAWIAYYLPDGVSVQVDVYELTSANDCRERDPKDWVLEGSQDKGCTWTVLDTRSSQLFSGRFERRSFEISTEKKSACNALRFKFSSIRNPSSEPRLQISCIDFYKIKP